MASALSEYENKSVHIITSDGRNIVGKLSGYDQLQNLILSEASERIFSSVSKPEVVPLGLFVVRGDNVAVVAFVEEKDDVGWEAVQCEPLRPIQHEVL